MESKSHNDITMILITRVETHCNLESRLDEMALLKGLQYSAKFTHLRKLHVEFECSDTEVDFSGIVTFLAAMSLLQGGFEMCKHPDRHHDR